MKSFIKMIKSQETIELMKDPNVFTLLAQIAYRAKRTKDFSIHGLEVGEALIGDYNSIGLTRGQYREAIKRATKYNQIATNKTTNKGTIVKLINSDIFDINEEVEQPPKQPDNNQTTTTNKNDKKEKNNIYSKKHVPFQAVVDLFNELLPELPPVQLVTEERKKAMKARWNTSEKTQNLDWWKEFFSHIRQSDFLMGKKVDDFNATFDWIMKKSNFVKIIEGNYHK
jgi:hypothetical protein